MTTLLALSGSLRAGSLNTRIIRTLPALAPSGAAIAQFELAELPFYNQDLDAETVPDIVAALRAAVSEADGLVIASPEYNHTYTAVIKNAIDWASRPLMKGAILGKTAMVICAGPGPGGGKHCLPALAGLLELLGCRIVASVGVAAAHEKLAPESDQIIDADLADQLRAGLAAF